jgi:chemotaxis protein MotA
MLARRNLAAGGLIRHESARGVNGLRRSFDACGASRIQARGRLGGSAVATGDAVAILGDPMLILVGYVIVAGAIFGGFALAGGHLGALYQPLELLMIGGGAVGAFVVGNPIKTIMATLKTLPTMLRGSKYNKKLYMELMALLYDLLDKIRREGLLAIEGDVDSPKDSPIFSRYPRVLADHHLVEFICDYLRLMVGGSLNAIELESLMDREIDTHHQEGEVPAHALQRVGDALPAFGIVAAVMGVVHTMESVGLPPAELGVLIAHALVGTFLGILLAYGFIGPLPSVIEQKLQESSKALECIKVTLLASLNDSVPAVAVEFGRKVLYSTERPGFAELESHVKGGGRAAPANAAPAKS